MSAEETTISEEQSVSTPAEDELVSDDVLSLAFDKLTGEKPAKVEGEKEGAVTEEPEQVAVEPEGEIEPEAEEVSENLPSATEGEVEELPEEPEDPRVRSRLGKKVKGLSDENALLKKELEAVKSTLEILTKYQTEKPEVDPTDLIFGEDKDEPVTAEQLEKWYSMRREKERQEAEAARRREEEQRMKVDSEYTETYWKEIDELEESEEYKDISSDLIKLLTDTKDDRFNKRYSNDPVADFNKNLLGALTYYYNQEKSSKKTALRTEKPKGGLGAPTTKIKGGTEPKRRPLSPAAKEYADYLRAQGVKDVDKYIEEMMEEETR